MKKQGNRIITILIVLFALIVLVSFTACRTQKDGCGNYSSWEARHSKFNK